MVITMRKLSIWRKHGRRVAVILLAVGVLIPFGDTARSSTQAKSVIRLSATKKNYFLHGVWDKLILKNVPSGAKICWKSSDKKVVRVQEHIKNGIWYRVNRDGQATVTAIYKGKKYSCRIRVRRETETPAPTSSAIPTPDTDGTVEEDDDTTSPVSDPAKPLSTPTPDERRVAGGENQAIFDQKIEDFREWYISEGMSEYDKVDAVCRFISYEFDYDSRESNWFMMVVKGAGDCAASRYGVYSLCTDLGIRAFPCINLEDHGRTMVRIGDDVYMTITGYGGVKPRNYRLYHMSEAELSAYLLRYPASKYMLGLE